ncbi:hypothetical protein ACSNOH_13110 [Streptomyces sp. URMC 127]|uniref:hypothetical protein n=1 Tax=Streptomyces sp. URMC 127 TaxID=3423402 RepID=UPI003F19F9A1
MSGALIAMRQHGPVFIEPDGIRLTLTATAETFRALTGMSLQATRNGWLDRRRRSLQHGDMPAIPYRALTGSN